MSIILIILAYVLGLFFSAKIQTKKVGFARYYFNQLLIVLLSAGLILAVFALAVKLDWNWVLEPRWVLAGLSIVAMIIFNMKEEYLIQTKSTPEAIVRFVITILAIIFVFYLLFKLGFIVP